MDYMKEVEGKHTHDPIFSYTKPLHLHQTPKKPPLPCNIRGAAAAAAAAARRVWVPGAVIVGAGPSGLAVAACLKQLGVPRLVLERSNCVASLWQLHTYDRLRLHLPKHLCQLPHFPFPANFPTYPTKQHFISYVESYVDRFNIKPVFNRRVVSAEFDPSWGLWRVKTAAASEDGEETEYVCRWVVAATGENAEPVVPSVEGLHEFKGKVTHSSEYKCGSEFRGEKVLVVGCGNSGMELSLDLLFHSARPCLVVRDMIHVLPKEMFGTSTFELSTRLMKWVSVRVVDRILLLLSRMIIGDTEELGLHRPPVGPIQLKETQGKTPVLDTGTLAEIRTANIKIFPGITRVFEDSVEFDDGRVEIFDAIVFATGFKSNVPSWLRESKMFSRENGFPVKPFPNGWKGDNGLYAAGFTRRAILGLSQDAQRIADDINTIWKANDNHFMGCPNATLSEFLAN